MTFHSRLPIVVGLAIARIEMALSRLAYVGLTAFTLELVATLALRTLATNASKGTAS